MTRLLFIGASAFALCALPIAAQAQTTSSDEVVVVANRTPQALSKIGQSVTLLDAKAIQSSQTTQLADLLEQTPGISLSRNGGEGQPTSIYIRGAEADQTLVLIDGVQLNDPSQPAGGFDFANLLTGDISRVEILRGAQSTLWGSQAIGGVVDIVTAQPSRALQGDIDVQGGSRDTQDYNAGVGGTLDKLSFRLAGDYYTTAGVSAFDKALGGQEADGFHNTGFSGRLGYAFTPDVQLDLRGYYTSSWNAFDGYDTPSGDLGDDAEYGKTTQSIGYAGLNFNLLDSRLKNRLAVQYTDTDRRFYDPGPAGEAYAGNETFYGYGANTRIEYQGTLDVAPGYTAVFGAQRERSTINSGPPTAFSPVVKAATGITSGYGQIQGEVITGLTLTGGVRYDNHDTFGGHTTGQVSAAWSLNNGTTLLRASFGQGFKAPALYQLFSPYGSVTQKLAPLQPETSNSWDLGVEQRFWGDRAMVSATYFGRDTRDLIQFVSTFTPPFGAYANVDHATAEGIELQARAKLSPDLSLSANYTYTDAENATDHSALLRRPRNTANASATYVWPIRLTTTLAARYAGESHDQGFDAQFNTIPVVLKAYTLVDLKAAYPINDRLEVYGRIENLFDQHYETAYQFGTLGRGAFAGVRAKF